MRMGLLRKRSIPRDARGGIANDKGTKGSSNEREVLCVRKKSLGRWNVEDRRWGWIRGKLS